MRESVDAGAQPDRAGAREGRAGGGERSVRVSEVLAAEVLERLYQLDLLAAGKRHSAADVERIRRSLRELVDAWRRLLEHHTAAGDGRCLRCRRWWGRRRGWPCRVWMAAHTALVAHDRPVAWRHPNTTPR